MSVEELSHVDRRNKTALTLLLGAAGVGEGAEPKAGMVRKRGFSFFTSLHLPPPFRIAGGNMTSVLRDIITRRAADVAFRFLSASSACQNVGPGKGVATKLS